MTQLEQINEEKSILKNAIEESVNRINKIANGAEVEIKVNTTYNQALGGKKHFVSCNVDVNVII